MSTSAPDRSTQDVGNILGLEHVNLVVPDRELAERFYVSGLGLTRDPYVDLGLFGTTWVNLGAQQFHLVLGDEPQRLRGVIGLVVPDPDTVARRVERLAGQPALADTELACRPAVDGRAGFDVTGPWGNRFRIHGPGEIDGIDVGVAYVRLEVGVGAAAGIGGFYREVFGAPTHVETGDGNPRAVVTVGRHQHLIFAESDSDPAAYDGHHVAVYLHNFSGPYHWLRSRDLITRDRDTHEYRFQQIVDPVSGTECFELEHEVRSMFHPMFGRHLVNRNPAQGLGERYRRGIDVQPGLHNAGLG